MTHKPFMPLGRAATLGPTLGVALGVALLLAAACGGAPPKQASKNDKPSQAGTASVAAAAPVSDQARRDRVQALEADLTRLELQLGQMQQQQHDQSIQARELSRQAALDLAAVKQSLGMQPQVAATVKLPGVEDEATAASASKAVQTSRPAATSKAAKASKPAPKPAAGSGALARTLRVIVLLAIVFLFFKFLARWHADDEMDDDAPDDLDAIRPVPSATGPSVSMTASPARSPEPATTTAPATPSDADADAPAEPSSRPEETE
jgi:hypothetical protein